MSCHDLCYSREVKIFLVTGNWLNFDRAKYLQVLDLERTKIVRLPDGVRDLIQQTYLGLMQTYISKLLARIGYLSALQTLDTRWCGDITTLPMKILDLVRLKHIKMIKSTCVGGVKIPRGPERLSNILTLTSIHAGDGIERVPRIAQSNSSQKIGSEGCGRRECRRAACFGLQNILSLSLEAKHTFNQGTLILSRTFSPPPLLRKLRLEGILQKLPDLIGSMDSLTNLRLGFSSV